MSEAAKKQLKNGIIISIISVLLGVIATASTGIVKTNLNTEKRVIVLEQRCEYQERQYQSMTKKVDEIVLMVERMSEEQSDFYKDMRKVFLSKKNKNE